MTEGTLNFTAALEDGLKALNIPAPEPAALVSLQRYFAELEKWGRKINLVARAAPEQIIENHFLDSLTLLTPDSRYGGTEPVRCRKRCRIPRPGP